LHLGNLLQIILLRRFALFGFQAIAVIGGATAMIGDPSGKNKERNLLSVSQLTKNVKAISKQLADLVSYQVVSDFNILDLIRDFNLLNNHDYQFLEMILKSINSKKSINSNLHYQNNLALILVKLSLPLEETNLSVQELMELYQNLNLNVNCLEQKQNLLNLNFSQLLTYVKT